MSEVQLKLSCFFCPFGISLRKKNCVLPTLYLVATLLWIELSPVPTDLTLLKRGN